MSQPTKITIPAPIDAHTHLRGGPKGLEDRTYLALYHGLRTFCALLVMPNTDPPILTAQDVVAYKNLLEPMATEIAHLHHNKIGRPLDYQLLMTLKITPATTPAMIEEAAPHISAVKIYPEGVTTNSDDGVNDFRTLKDVLRACQDKQIPVLIHGEKPGQGIMYLDREEKFLEIAAWIRTTYIDNLRWTLEHLSTRQAVDFVDFHALHQFDVWGTITPHHLMLTGNDVVDGKIKPHNHCMPFPKSFVDQATLRKAATNPQFTACRNFMLGTDSAPHDVSTKECAAGCAGIFNAPVAIESVIEVFLQEYSQLQRDSFRAFVRDNAVTFYKRDKLEDLCADWGLIFVNEPWQVDMATYQSATVQPFRFGEQIPWQLKGWEKA